MKKSVIPLLLAVLALVASISYAWMGVSELKPYDVIEYKFGTDSDYQIGVANIDLSASFAIRDEDGTYVEVKKTNGELFPIADMVPSDDIAFKISFENHADSNVRLSARFAGITSQTMNDAGQPKLCEMMYVTLAGTSGYPENFREMPQTQFHSMSDSLQLTSDGTFTCSLVEGVVIPPTGDAPIDLYFYLSFAENADISYADLDLQLTNILITQ